MRKSKIALAVVFATRVLPVLAGQGSTGYANPISPKMTARWEQLMNSIPPGTGLDSDDINPTVDATGEYCMVGQSGRTWFLGGVNFGGTAIRDCSIPAGEAVFFPVINVVDT